MMGHRYRALGVRDSAVPAVLQRHGRRAVGAHTLLDEQPVLLEGVRPPAVRGERAKCRHQALIFLVLHDRRKDTRLGCAPDTLTLPARQQGKGAALCLFFFRSPQGLAYPLRPGSGHSRNGVCSGRLQLAREPPYAPVATCARFDATRFESKVAHPSQVGTTVQQAEWRMGRAFATSLAVVLAS